MKKLLAPMSFVLMAFLYPFKVLAGSGVIPGAVWDLDSIVLWLTHVINWLITFGAIAAVIFIIIGGVQYMLAGGDDEKAVKARKRILNGVIGLVIILAAGFIVKTVIDIISPATQVQL